MDADVGHVSATCQLWRTRRRASQVQRFVRSSGIRTGCTITYFITYVVWLMPPPDMSLSALSPPPKCHFIYTYICSYTPLDKKEQLYVIGPCTCHRSCLGIIRPLFALLFLGLKCHYHTQLAEIIYNIYILSILNFLHPNIYPFCRYPPSIRIK